jgi:hypothetical protein
MAKRPHTELNCSPDGPWITLQGKNASLTFNLRELIRDMMPAQSVAGKRHLMAEWLRDRDAEGDAKISPPDVPIGVKLGPRMKGRR